MPAHDVAAPAAPLHEDDDVQAAQEQRVRPHGTALAGRLAGADLAHVAGQPLDAVGVGEVPDRRAGDVAGVLEHRRDAVAGHVAQPEARHLQPVADRQQRRVRVAELVAHRVVVAVGVQVGARPDLRREHAPRAGGVDVGAGPEQAPLGERVATPVAAALVAAADPPHELLVTSLQMDPAAALTVPGREVAGDEPVAPVAPVGVALHQHRVREAGDRAERGPWRCRSRTRRGRCARTPPAR